MKRGLFITFEGCDGSGKSTQIRTLEKTLQEFGRKVLVLREPGATSVGEKIREIVLHPDNHEITPLAELFLYEAARAQMVGEIVEPALREGTIVLCDRFFDSTTAYQGFGRGLNLDMIDRLNLDVAGSAIPDKTIFLDIDPHCGLGRATRRATDRLEGEGVDFQCKVREGFLHAVQHYPSRVARVEVCDEKQETARLIREALEPLGLFTSRARHENSEGSGNSGDSGNSEGSGDSGNMKPSGERP